MFQLASRRLRAASTTIGFGLLVAARSHAETSDVLDETVPPYQVERSHWFSEHWLTLHARAGLGGPVGLIGGTLTLNFHDRVGAGVGVGVNGQGAQTAALLRFRPLIWQTQRNLLRATAIEFAVSSGPGSGGYTPAGEGRGAPFGWSRITWLQVEAQYELVKVTGISCLAGLGFAVPVSDSGDPKCLRSGEEGGCSNETRSPQPSLSLSGAIGYAF